MNTYNRDFGYFHIEKLTVKSFDQNDNLTNNLDMIENGCNVSPGTMYFARNFFVTP